MQLLEHGDQVALSKRDALEFAEISLETVSNISKSAGHVFGLTYDNWKVSKAGIGT